MSLSPSLARLARRASDPRLRVGLLILSSEQSTACLMSLFWRALTICDRLRGKPRQGDAQAGRCGKEAESRLSLAGGSLASGNRQYPNLLRKTGRIRWKDRILLRGSWPQNWKERNLLRQPRSKSCDFWMSTRRFSAAEEPSARSGAPIEAAASGRSTSCGIERGCGSAGFASAVMGSWRTACGGVWLTCNPPGASGDNGSCYVSGTEHRSGSFARRSSSSSSWRQSDCGCKAMSCAAYGRAV